MSDSNLTNLLFAEESTFNEVPDNLSTLKEVRFTGETLVPIKGTTESAEVRTERDLREIVKVSESSEGGFTAELVGGDFSPLIEAALCGTWVTSTDSVTGTFDSGAQTFTLDSGTFSAAFQLARLVKIANAATSGHDGVHRIVSITSTVITFKAGTITASDAADAVDLTYNYVVPGTTKRSFLVEQQYTSLASDYFIGFGGFTVGEMTVSAEPNALVIAGFNGLGGRVNKGSATFGDGSPTAPTTNPTISTSSGIEEILIAGTANDCTNRLELSTNNNIRAREVLGSLYSKQHGKGRFLPSGQVDLYFETSAELTAFLDHTARELQFVLADDSGNKFSFHFPAAYYTQGDAPVEALDSDIVTPLQFTGVRGGASTPYALQVDYVAA